MPAKTCADCHQHGLVVGRNLCRTCYRKHRNAGTLDRYPTLRPRGYGCPPQVPDEVTYRQLDYWATAGYLHPTVANPGSGSVREWPEEELAVAAAMGRLCAAGLPVRLAHQVARGNPELAPGIRIVIDPVEVAP